MCTRRAQPECGLVRPGSAGQAAAATSGTGARAPIHGRRRRWLIRQREEGGCSRGGGVAAALGGGGEGKEGRGGRGVARGGGASRQRLVAGWRGHGHKGAIEAGGRRG